MVWPLLGPLLVVAFDVLVFLTMVIIVRRAAREYESTWRSDQSSLPESEFQSEPETMPQAALVSPRAAQWF